MGIIPASKKGWKWKEKILALYFGMTDPVTPFWSKIPAFVSIIYLISPVDLIPDIIPFAGWLDDLVIVPLLLDYQLDYCPGRFVKEQEPGRGMSQVLGAFLIIILIILVLVAIGLIYLLKTAIYRTSFPNH